METNKSYALLLLSFPYLCVTSGTGQIIANIPTPSYIADLEKHHTTNNVSLPTDKAQPYNNGNENPNLALCVELVGSRFLRRMVRLLVVRSWID